MNARARLVLSVGQDSAALATRNQVLERAGFTIITTGDLIAAIHLFRDHPVDVVVLGHGIAPPERQRIATQFRELKSYVPIVMLYRFGDGSRLNGVADFYVGSLLDGPEALIEAVQAATRRNVAVNHKLSQDGLADRAQVAVEQARRLIEISEQLRQQLRRRIGTATEHHKQLLGLANDSVSIVLHSVALTKPHRAQRAG